jgi:hypothetical protein
MTMRKAMKILTQYVYEKVWRPTSEADAVAIIKEEIGDADPEGTWQYVKGEIGKGKTITVGECRFRAEA